MDFFLRRYISHPSSASISTATPAPTPMPALAPVLRDEDGDPLVLLEIRIVFVALACWPVEDRPVDDRPVDDGSVVCTLVMQ